MQSGSLGVMVFLVLPPDIFLDSISLLIMPTRHYYLFQGARHSMNTSGSHLLYMNRNLLNESSQQYV